MVFPSALKVSGCFTAYRAGLASVICLGLLLSPGIGSAAKAGKPAKNTGNVTRSKVKSPVAETGYGSASGANRATRAPGAESSYKGAAATAPKSTTPDKDTIRVALFADPSSTGQTSRNATWQVIDKVPGIKALMVTKEQVQAPDFFDHFDVLILPGGSGAGEAKAVGVDAGQELARRVKAGKGIVAICAGGYYVAEGWNPETNALNIVNAQNHDGEHWARGEQFIAVEVVGKDDKTTSKTIWYENGPIFKRAKLDMPKYVTLVRYVSDLAAKDAPTGQMKGRDAVIAAPYGKGRVVAFGPHPERTPELNHWLINAIKWAAGKHGGKAINAEVVLEGR